MKTKQTTKERRQMREIDVINHDLRDEFGSTYNDYDVIDELAMSEVEEDEL